MEFMIKAVGMSAIVSAMLAVGCSGADPSTGTIDPNAAAGNDQAADVADTANDDSVDTASLGGCFPIAKSLLASKAAPSSAAEVGLVGGSRLFAKNIKLLPLATSVRPVAADFDSIKLDDADIEINAPQAGVQSLTAQEALLGLGALANVTSIVGLWQGKVLDAAGNTTINMFKTWHADFTEQQIDSLSTIAGNSCMGTWIPLGGRTFGLTHPFYTFDYATGGSNGASGIIYEKVTVAANGKTYAGGVRVKVVVGLDPFDASAYVIFDDSSSKTTAKRVTVDASQLP